MAAAKTKIRILPRRAVVLGGESVGEGAIVSVDAKEAALLVDDGYATRELAAPGGKPAGKPKPKRRRPLDLATADDDPTVLERGGDDPGGPTGVV